eukprot:CAMPEP_0201918734 /NCGR_PEP_ID=MMETSP0903-20130614/7805_1 /ASSEMBLY_ACC=CAM_ASM_000552 /TAXON_ID=420261 /ORGANISM="Thalassiosira antarctica, Strain CCMP982" /LENGTH=716 /DNA_ID=CAMNT_0048455101 /DNA_START=103 /DNA_END=2253 /DNA_ORIENTATION=+
MPTNIDAENDGDEENCEGGFAPDAAMETHGDAKSTNAWEFTMTAKDSSRKGTSAYADDDVQSNVRGDGEEGSVDKNSDGNMENVDGSNDYEAARESAAMISTSNDNSAHENTGKSCVDRSARGAEEKTSEEEYMVDGGLSWNSGMELDEIGRSHQAFLPETMPASATKPMSFRNKKQDAFVKKGARAKALLTTALRAMADGFTSNAAGGLCGDVAGDKNDGNESMGISGQKQTMDNDDDGCLRKTWNTRADFAHVQDVAQEKSKECISLKRKLQESHSHVEVLQNENSTSQQSNTQLKAKIDRTLEALQIAGANAANARAEADASNARAESLSGQLNDLQSVIEETKRGMEVVRREHDEVSRAARSVEGRLIQVESELTRAARAKKDAVEERDFLKARAEKSEKLVMSLQEKVNDYHDEVRGLKKDLLEMEELEKVRSDRTQRIESEFQEARAGLLEATSAAAEAESTVTSLRSVIEELRRENESLHEQMNASRDSLCKDRAKQNEALTLAEREAQKWKMKYEEADEEARKLNMDKTSAEKQVDQFKSRVANMERRLNDSSRLEKNSSASSAVTPHSSNNLGFINAFGAKDAPVVSEENKKRRYVAELPQRESSKAPPSSSSRQLTYSYQKENENKSNANNVQDRLQRNESFYGGPKRKVARTNKCCLCAKEGGMILSCQCDRINCDKRAHALCIGNFRSGKNDSGKTILCREVGE